MVALALLGYYYIWEGNLSFPAIICRFDVFSVQLQLSFPICSAKQKLGSWLLTFTSSLCSYWATVPLESLFYPRIKSGMESLLHFGFGFPSSFLIWLRVLPGHWVRAAPRGLPPSGQPRRARSWSSLPLRARDTAALSILPSCCASAAASSFLTFLLCFQHQFQH